MKCIQSSRRGGADRLGAESQFKSHTVFADFNNIHFLEIDERQIIRSFAPIVHSRRSHSFLQLDWLSSLSIVLC